MNDYQQFIAWCKSVIHHAALNAIRVQRRYQDRVVLYDMNDFRFQTVGRAYDQHSLIKQGDWSQILDFLLPTEREILKLVYVYGYTQRETAHFLRTTQQRVSVMHRQALNRLRKVLSVS